MKLHQLRDVVAVADCGSLRSAARTLGLSQSAMTKSIQALEREVGAPLFERQRRSTIATPVGRRFIQRARTALGELERARDEVQQQLGAGVAQVTVSLSTVPLMAMLPEALKGLLQRFPQARVSVVEGVGFAAVEAQLRDGSVDFYVGVAPARRPPSEFAVETVYAHDRCIIARSDHPLARARTLADLVDARWVTPAPGPAASEFTQLFVSQDLPVPTHVVHGGSILGAMTLVLHADALAVVPQQWLDFGALEGKVTRLPVRESIPAPVIALIRRTAFPLTPAAEHFADLFRRAGEHLRRGYRRPKTSSASRKG